MPNHWLNVKWQDVLLAHIKTFSWIPGTCFLQELQNWIEPVKKQLKIELVNLEFSNDSDSNILEFKIWASKTITQGTAFNDSFLETFLPSDFGFKKFEIRMN